MRYLYGKDWEQHLEMKMLECDRNKRKAYICSPLSAFTEDEVLRNMHIAIAYMYYVIERMGYLAKAPHAYLPILLCDKIPVERAIALKYGLSLLETCELLLVCGKRISDGMRGEIAHAATLRMPIYTFHKDVYYEVIEEVRRNNGDVNMVYLDTNHPLLSHTHPTTNLEWLRLPVSV